MWRLMSRYFVLFRWLLFVANLDTPVTSLSHLMFIFTSTWSGLTSLFLVLGPPFFTKAQCLHDIANAILVVQSWVSSGHHTITFAWLSTTSVSIVVANSQSWSQSLFFSSSIWFLWEFSLYPDGHTNGYKWIIKFFFTTLNYCTIV